MSLMSMRASQNCIRLSLQVACNCLFQSLPNLLYMATRGSTMEGLRLLFAFIALAFIGSLGASLEIKNATKSSRHKRLFSLFNIIQFKNDPCRTTSSPDTIGTCMSAEECSNSVGTQDGTCASGFGACCLFIVTGCSGQVTKNCTYIRNEGFPGPDPSIGRTCTFNLNRIENDICQIRLDFASVTTLPIIGANAGQCGNTGDSLNVLSPFSSSRFAFPPTVCGTLTGQHMYFDSGKTGLAGTVNIVQGSGAGDRRYNIKVNYIHCTSRFRAPSGCTQYFTGCVGTIMSYNFGQYLENQHYGNCIRQEEGYCSVQYSETQILNPDPFSVSQSGSVTDNCQGDNHVTIPSTIVQYTGLVIILPSQMVPGEDRITRVPSMRCGMTFGSLPDSLTPGTLTSQVDTPFVVNVRSASGDANALDMLTGFSLDYRQVPC